MTFYHENSAVTSCIRDLMFGKGADEIARNHIACDVCASACVWWICGWIAVNAHLNRSGKRWGCNKNFRRSKGLCILKN